MVTSTQPPEGLVTDSETVEGLSAPVVHHALHGHQASLKDGLGFVNTLEFARGRVVEHLDTATAALVWFHEHALLHAETLETESGRFGTDGVASERTLRRVHRVRAAIRELLVATVEGRPPGGRQLDDMNRALRFHYVTYLVPAPDGVSLDHKHEGDPVEGALARLAESIARELTQGRPERLRVCENEECRWIYLDTSHSGRRKWCDMRTCGNRVKVARHRQRRREEGQPVAADEPSADAPPARVPPARVPPARVPSAHVPAAHVPAADAGPGAADTSTG